MPLSGQAMLITLMDADPAEERNFNQWYDNEHIIERVSIPGFLEARRYIAVAAEPKYLNFYTTETLDVLRSPAYLQALRNPTAWTQHHMPKFRNFTRAVARVSASRGQGRGGALAFSRIRPSDADAAALRKTITTQLDAMLDRVTSVHLLESNPELSKAGRCLRAGYRRARLVRCRGRDGREIRAAAWRPAIRTKRQVAGRRNDLVRQLSAAVGSGEGRA